MIPNQDIIEGKPITIDHIRLSVQGHELKASELKGTVQNILINWYVRSEVRSYD